MKYYLFAFSFEKKIMFEWLLGSLTASMRYRAWMRAICFNPGVFDFYLGVKYPLWKLSRNKILNKFLYVFAFYLKKVKKFYKCSLKYFYAVAYLLHKKCQFLILTPAGRNCHLGDSEDIDYSVNI